MQRERGISYILILKVLIRLGSLPLCYATSWFSREKTENHKLHYLSHVLSARWLSYSAGTQAEPHRHKTSTMNWNQACLFNGLQVDTLQHKTVFKEHCTVSSALYVTRDTTHGETEMRVTVSQIPPLLIEDLVIAPQLW